MWSSLLKYSSRYFPPTLSIILCMTGPILPDALAAAQMPQAEPAIHPTPNAKNTDRRNALQLSALHLLEKQHYQAEWQEDPVSATLSGVHDYDTLLPDLSSAAQARRLARLRNEVKALKKLDLSATSLREQDDRDILLANLKGEILTETVIRPDLHQPDATISIVTESIYGLITRDFAPLPERMESVIARLEKIPPFLKSGAENLRNVPAIYNEIALENLEGAFAFFRTDLPKAFTSLNDADLQRHFQQANQGVLKALATYRTQLQHLRTNAHFALGRPAMVQILAADMIKTPPETILALGNKRLAADRAEFLRVSQQINPQHPERALNDIRKNHPQEDELVSTAKQQLQDTRQFVVTHHLVTLPSSGLPDVRLTPAFEQALFTAATEWPGPYEKQDLPSFYNITPPSPHFTAKEKEEALEDFNHAELLNITVHEAMPGHFVQGLYMQSHPEWSAVRRNAASYTTTEGWAHYTEQMMVEQGLDHASPALHLMQLQDALLRDCRLIVSFGLHMQNMSLPQATDIMQKRCFQSPVAAYKEARRGTVDPGYFSYALGKMLLLKLRDDQENALGTHFSLLHFHDAILESGLVPVTIIRREMASPDTIFKTKSDGTSL